MRLTPKLHQAGDTIIEVIIAMVIITSVLATTLAIVSRSQKATQANHERDQAVLYANQQAELIRAGSMDDRALYITNHASRSSFCTELDGNDSGSTCTKDTIFTIKVEPQPCGVSPTCASLPPALNRNQYLITVKWDSLVTGNIDQVSLTYGI